MPDFSILDKMPNIGASFNAGFQGARDNIRKEQARSALSAYAQNPNDPQAMNALAQFDPETAMAARAAQQKNQMEQDKQRQEYQFNQAERQQKHEKEGRDIIGQSAILIAGMTDDRRPAAWDAAVDLHSAQYPGLARLRGKYSEANLHAALAEGGVADQYARMSQDRIAGTPESGFEIIPNSGYGRRNSTQGSAPPPADDAAFAAAYDALPQGASFTHPDGSRRTKGGAGPQTPPTFP